MSENAQKREQQPQISVPVDSEMLARVKSAAEADHRSVASFTRLVLARALDQGEGAAA